MNICKGKRKDNGEWVGGCLLISDERYFIIPEFGVSYIEEVKYRKTDKLITLYAFEVYPETVCQYTGLTDKNGKKIFEGDIVGIYSNYRKEYDYGVVEYGEFNCSCCHGVYGWYFENEDIRNYKMYEVKGNVFDNPELIRQ